jgi:hypothetical protein
MERRIEAETIAAIGENNWRRLSPDEQAKRLECGRRAHFKRLALRSAVARRRRQETA